MDNFGVIFPSKTQTLTGQKTLGQRIGSDKKDNKKDNKKDDNDSQSPTFENNNLSSIICCCCCSSCILMICYFIFKGVGIKT